MQQNPRMLGHEACPSVSKDLDGTACRLREARPACTKFVYNRFTSYNAFWTTLEQGQDDLIPRPIKFQLHRIIHAFISGLSCILIILRRQTGMNHCKHVRRQCLQRVVKQACSPSFIDLHAEYCVQGGIKTHLEVRHGFFMLDVHGNAQDIQIIYSTSGGKRKASMQPFQLQVTQQHVNAVTPDANLYLHMFRIGTDIQISKLPSTPTRLPDFAGCEMKQPVVRTTSSALNCTKNRMHCCIVLWHRLAVLPPFYSSQRSQDLSCNDQL